MTQIDSDASPDDANVLSLASHEAMIVSSPSEAVRPAREAGNAHVADANAVEYTSAPPTTLGDFLRTLLPGKRGKLAQLTNLHRAIAEYPEEAANYVMRGELYLSIEEYALANADFYKALALARAEIVSARWGVVAQAVQDRAILGLEAIDRLGLPEMATPNLFEEANMRNEMSAREEMSASEIERRYATD